MTMDKSILRRKMLLFSVYIGSAKKVFSLVENTRVRLNLSSWAAVSSSLCSHLCTMLSIAPAEESPAPLGFWLRVYLSLSCLWTSSGALGTFPAYAMAGIAPLRKSSEEEMQKHCWCLVPSLADCISQLLKDGRTTGCSGFCPNSSVCDSFLFVLYLVVIVSRWQVKGTLMFVPCVYERLGFLLSGTCKRSIVILS